MSNNNYLIEAEKAETQRRQQTILWCRIRCGVMEIFRKPWKALLIAVLCVVTVLMYGNKPVILALFPINSRSRLPMQICSISVSAIIILAFIFSFVGLLVLLGTPLHAKQIEASLAHIGLTDRYGFPPVLVVFGKACRNPAIKEMHFYSRGIDRLLWIQRQAAIEDILNVTITEPISYGKSRNYIVLTVVPGAATRRTEPLYDDEL